jgi:PAS domain S-box-containing protein
MRSVKNQTERELRSELERTQARLAESEATMRAIRNGEVDAIVIDGPQGSRIFTLQSPEEPYRILAERMNEAAVTLTAEGTILFCNRRLAEMTGVPAERLVGSPFISLLREEDRQSFAKLLRHALENEIRAEGHLLHQDGTTLPVQLSLSSIPLEESGRGICLIATDLTEQKRAEQKLREQAALLDLAHDAILVRDRGITYWSRGAEELYGWSAEEVVGKVANELLQTEFPESPEAIEAALQNTRQWEGELHQICRKGRAIMVDSRWSLLRDEQGNRAAIMEINRDITERKRAEEELARRAEELALSNAELEQFAYVASHDLQEPLRMVASFTQLLAERYQGKLGADADEFIGYAVDGARQMQMLVNDLLEYSRVGTRGKEFSAVDCERVLETVLRNLQVTLEESGGQVTHDPLPTVQGNEMQLRQILQNLVGNALKFHGSEPPRAHVSAQEVDGEWRFSVRDNGIGIDPQHAARIFLLFQRLHTRAAYPGTGMGLAIAKKIVERQGGRIWVESEEGKGSTFYFSLPMKGVAHGNALRTSAAS